jgi:uncharacterized protein (TIGR03435 family)
MNLSCFALLLPASLSLSLYARAVQDDIGHGRSELAFEVASIKPIGELTAQRFLDALSQEQRRRRGKSLSLLPGGRWVARYTTLRKILFDLYPDYALSSRIVGGPPWVDTQLFDIQALAPEASSTDQVMQMVRRLLADRFKLRLIPAIRPVEVYTLVITRQDRKLGPGVRPPIDCARGATITRSGDSVPGPKPACRLMPTTDGRVLRLSGGASKVSDLIEWLQFKVDRPIVDRTGLSGEFALRFEVPAATRGATPERDGGSLPVLSSDLFTAVREQLGMSLLPRREPTNVLMIEHVEMPTAN